MRAKREFLASMRKKSQCKIECPSPEARVSSRDVPIHLIQDRSKAMVIVGTDVVGLYPNLTGEESAEEAYQAVMESDMNWDGVNRKEAMRLLAMKRSRMWCLRSKLRRVLPRGAEIFVCPIP